MLGFDWLAPTIDWLDAGQHSMIAYSRLNADGWVADVLNAIQRQAKSVAKTKTNTKARAKAKARVKAQAKVKATAKATTSTKAKASVRTKVSHRASA